MEAKLSVEIGADVSKLTQGMANAANVVSSGASKIDKSTITIQRNLNNLNKTPFTFGQNFQIQSQIAANGVNQLDNAVKKSRSNMQAWMYIIQDAPFGLMGIQNNLTQLIPGVGAASLAFSALISALTFSQVGMTYWNKGAKETKKASDELTESLKIYVDNLDSVNSALLRGQQSSQREIVSLKSLYSATQNTNLSLKERKNAVDELQRQYPAYFGNLKDEDILAGNASNAYQNLTQQIIAKSKAQAFGDKIAENSNKILELDIANKSKQETIESRLTAIRKQWNEAVYRGKGNAEIDAGRAKQLDEVLKRTRENLEAELGLTDSRYQRLGLLTDNVRLESEINNIIKEQGVEVLGVNEELKKQEKSGDKRVKSQKSLNQLMEEYYSLLIDINKDIQNFEEENLKRDSNSLSKLSGADGTNTRKLNDLVINQPKLSQNEPLNIPIVSELDLAIMRIGEQASELKNGIAPLLTDAFYSLGEAINSGDFAGFGEGILRAMSGFIADLGQMFIKEGLMQIAAGIAKNIALPGSGMPNILSGKMLIAAGALGSVGAGLMGSTSMGKSSPGYQVPKFANGVTNFSGGMALVGERGPELVSLPTGSNVITNENIRRYGAGGGSQVFIPNMKIEGQDLVVVFDRASRNRNRIT